MPDVPFSDFGLKWFKDIIGQITTWFTKELIDGYRSITSEIFGTPLPEGSGTSAIFSPPAANDEPWHSIYDSVVAGEVMIFALIILFLIVQGRHFVRIFNVGDAYGDRKARNQAWTGAVLIVAWYWIGVLALYFVQGLTIGLIPNVNEIGSSLIKLLPAAASNPLLTLLLTAVGGLSMVILKGIYFIREVLLYVYLFGMPFGIAIAYGNLPVLSQIARRLCWQFIPLAVLPLPAAVLLRGYELLFAGKSLVSLASIFEHYLVVVSLPVLALVVTWKTFRYASPLTARALGTASKTAVQLGAVAGLGYTAGPRAATTTARWGVRAGAGQAAANRIFDDESAADGQSAQPNTAQDNIASDADGGAPAYRRRENDPGYY